MEWPTHALSGVLAGYVITSDWRGGVVGGIASIIPDLDEPNSKLGKILLPISIPLNQMFGHRTLTHSLPFALLLSGIVLYFTEWWIALAVFAGVIAHSLGDMLTGTVNFFYPLKIPVGFRIHPYSFVMVDRLTRFVISIILIFIFLHEIKY